MFVVPAFFIGAIIGWIRAGKRGGNRLDKLQYAVAHGIALFLLTLVLTLAGDWMGLL
jgi:hypothetical protein